MTLTFLIKIERRATAKQHEPNMFKNINLITYAISEFQLSWTNSFRITDKGLSSTFEQDHALLSSKNTT